MNLKKISKLLQDVSSLSMEEFNQFKAGFRVLSEEKRDQALGQFRIGEFVTFQGKPQKHGGRTIMIRVEKIGRTRLIGHEVDPRTRAKSFTRWRVSPSLCTKVDVKEELTS